MNLRRLLPLIGVLAAVYVAMMLLSAVRFGRDGEPWTWQAPNFIVQEDDNGGWTFNAYNQQKILEQAGINLILGVGMTFVILIAGIDLSVGSILAVSNVLFVITALHLAGGAPPGAGTLILACLAAVAAGLILGGINGVITVYGRVPSFITTLGMFLMAQGLAYQLSAGQTHHLAYPKGMNVAIPLITCLVGVVSAHVVLSQTVLGRHLYATGANIEAARLCGVPVNRVRILAFIISGACAALGGIIYWARLATGSHLAATVGYELYAIAAVVIGGTSLMGGEGSVIGTLIGALIMAVLYNGLNTVGIEETTQKIIIGAVIVAAAVYDQHRRAATL
jgi:ribose transport system permease protein